MTQFNDFWEYEQSIRAAQSKAKEEGEITVFLLKHPDLALDCNFGDEGLVRQWLERSGLEITQETIGIAVEALGGALARKTPQQVQTDAHNAVITEQKALLDEASGLLASWTDAGRADRLKQFARMPLAQFRVEVQNLKDAARLKTLSRKDLREATRSEYAAAHPQLAGGFPRLPDNFPPIRSLDGKQIREAAKKYGWVQLNNHQK